MRYNGNELKQMAVNSKKGCTKEGVLSLREKEGKLWNKTDVLTERWCRLVDNMFFYFKTKDSNSDPYGVFILEGSSVRTAENDQTNGCGFVLEFEGDSRSTYFLASRPSEAKEWINVMGNASYAKLKQKYEMLRHQQRELQGDDKQSSAAPRIVESRSGNSSPLILSRKKLSPKEYNMTLSDVEGTSGSKSGKKQKKYKLNRSKILPHDSLLPVLELRLNCVGLNINKTIEHKRHLQIHVQASFPPVPNWSSIFQTECIKAATSAQFLSTVSFFHDHLITPQTLLRFHLCQIKENSNVDSLGFASCVVSDLLYLDNVIHFDILNQDNCIGKLEVEVCREHISAQITKSSSEGKLSAVSIALKGITVQTITKEYLLIKSTLADLNFDIENIMLP